MRANFFVWILCAVLAINLARALSSKPQNQFQQWLNSKVFITAKIVSDPSIKNGRTSFDILPDGFKQKLETSIFGSGYFEYGDTIFVGGKIKQPVSLPDFDYVDYLRAKGVYAQISASEIYVLGKKNSLRRMIFRIKHSLFDSFQRRILENLAGIEIALVSGNRDFMAQADIDAFNEVGSAHMIAVSGFKLTLIFIALQSLVGFFRRRTILVFSAVFGLIYVSAADFAPAVMRALVMSLIYISASLSGRKYNIFLGLLATAALLISLNPLILLYDIGFILSFTGILGIIYFGPILTAMLNNLPELLGLKHLLISAAAAQIATAPLIAYYFHQLSPYGPLVNMLIVPMLAPLIIAGYFCVLPVIGVVVGSILTASLSLLLLIVNIFQKIPYSHVNVNVSLVGLFGLYLLEAAVLIGLNYLLKNPKTSVKLIR